MNSPANRQLSVAADAQGVAQQAAELFARVCQSAGATAHIALSGGSTPRALHTLLTTSPYLETIPWSKIQFYWGDERTVPPDDAESNFRMARETLLTRAPISEAQIHRIQAELPPEEAASRYAEELRQSFGLAPGQTPRFDLIFLGMGPDGHTLSLFPHTAALNVTDRLVVANYVPKLSTWRVTLTAPVANHAAVVAFLVAGQDKAGALAQVLEGPRNPQEYPSQLIAPAQGELHWYVDRAAASKLTSNG